MIMRDDVMEGEREGGEREGEDRDGYRRGRLIAACTYLYEVCKAFAVFVSASCKAHDT